MKKVIAKAVLEGANINDSHIGYTIIIRGKTLELYTELNLRFVKPFIGPSLGFFLSLSKDSSFNDIPFRLKVENLNKTSLSDLSDIFKTVIINDFVYDVILSLK